MSKYDSLAIIISFFGLWVSSYLSNKYEGADIFKASKFMLDKAGVACRKVHATISSLVLSFNEGDV